MKYCAFLSYSHKDRDVARWLHRALESFRPPRHLRDATGSAQSRRLSPIFRDREELPSSASLSEAVNEALRESDSLIVICSPAAAASRWVNEEIRTFRQLGRADRIFCFIADGEPGTRDERNCFPSALFEGGEISEEAFEPVAADARPEGDGRRNALLKIAAGLLCVGFDELKQRDLRRRHRRLASLTVLSVVIASTTAVLAVTATIARNEADLRRQQAEELIDFMLGDLHENLREIRRLDLYKGIGEHAMEYFAALGDLDESDRSLSQRAKNLRQIGEVMQEQGDLEAAFEAYAESQRIALELSRRIPDDPERQIDLANSAHYVGFLHWERGELPEARRQFELVLPIVNKLRAQYPASTRWLIESAYAYTNLGRVLELEGSYDEALDVYRNVMEFNRKLTELEPDNPEWRLELGFAHNNLGKLVATLGLLEDARFHYSQDLSIKAQLTEEFPDHVVWRSDLAVSRYFLGRLLVITSDLNEGMEHLRTAHNTFLELSRFDPDQTVYVARRASIERDLARGLLRQQQPDSAADLIDSSIGLYHDLLSADSNQVPWRRGLVSAQLFAVELQRGQGRIDEATAMLEEVSKGVALLVEKEPSSLESRRLAIYSEILRARLLSDNNAAEASVAVSSAEAQLHQYFSDSADPMVLKLWAEAHLLAGRENDADSIRQRLWDMGVRGTN